MSWDPRSMPVPPPGRCLGCYSDHHAPHLVDDPAGVTWCDGVRVEPPVDGHWVSMERAGESPLALLLYAACCAVIVASLVVLAIIT